jgi:hypothetical protein
LDAGPLGQFNLPVTLTPASNTIFFIHPTDGSDDFPGTAAQPWRTVEKALGADQRSGSRVAAVANAGNNVVVTILGGANTENVVGAINTPALLAGSVTVLQAPLPQTFELNMAGNQLTLNKGYKLQDIKITSTFGAAGVGRPQPKAAVLIQHPTAGLANVEVTCTGNPVTCVEVGGGGIHTLRDVTVDVADVNAANIGILNNATLSIVGGRVRLTGNNNAITLIDSVGVLSATGLTVDMTDGSRHVQASTGIDLQARTSLVTNSTIKVSNAAGATGIRVQPGANPSTVDDNEFIGLGAGVGVNGRGNLSSFRNNTFRGGFTREFQ